MTKPKKQSDESSRSRSGGDGTKPNPKKSTAATKGQVSDSGVDTGVLDPGHRDNNSESDPKQGGNEGLANNGGFDGGDDNSTLQVASLIPDIPEQKQEPGPEPEPEKTEKAKLEAAPKKRRRGRPRKKKQPEIELLPGTEVAKIGGILMAVASAKAISFIKKEKMNPADFALSPDEIQFLGPQIDLVLEQELKGKEVDPKTLLAYSVITIYAAKIIQHAI